MFTDVVLPLFPLTEAVLLPGEERELEVGGVPAPALARAKRAGGQLVASLLDGDSVHEVGVRGQIVSAGVDALSVRGLARCRLLALEDPEVPLVRVEDFPEAREDSRRAAGLGRLLLRRYQRLWHDLQRPVRPLDNPSLSELTWRILADCRLAPEQKQGFLNVPGPVTRGRLLLVVVRELERRERFLRAWRHLRQAAEWN